MINYYLDFLAHYDLPNDEKEFLVSAGHTLLDSHTEELSELIERYFEINFDIKSLEPERRALAEKSGLNYFTVNFIMLVCASARIREGYITKGYGEKLFYETFEDLFYKLRECKAVHGVYGIFVEFWYAGFFKYRIFKLGRLEFELSTFGSLEYSCPALSLTKGDPYLSVHIPSCGPLKKELRYDSYRRAYDFFQDRVMNGVIVFGCHSWLLNAENYNIFPKGSNTYDFLSDWDIVSSKEDVNFGDCWRVFNKHYKGDPDELPYDSSLRRAIVDHLKSGKHMGSGLGICVFDGEKIVNK